MPAGYSDGPHRFTRRRQFSTAPGGTPGWAVPRHAGTSDYRRPVGLDIVRPGRCNVPRHGGIAPRTVQATLQSPAQQPRITSETVSATSALVVGGTPNWAGRLEMSTSRIFQSLRTTTDPSLVVKAPCPRLPSRPMSPNESPSMAKYAFVAVQLDSSFTDRTMDPVLY